MARGTPTRAATPPTGSVQGAETRRRGRRFAHATALCLAIVAALLGYAGTAAAAEDPPYPAFTVAEWERLTEAASRGDARAEALRRGYLAGLRDGLRFYSRIGRTFQLCWPEDHEIDLKLLETVVRAVRREHPDLAKPSDNYAYVAILALLDAYSCR